MTESHDASLTAQEKVKVYEAARAQRKERLHEAEVKAEAGLKPEVGTFTANSELGCVKLQLVDAQSALATGKVVLDNAMGLEANAPDCTASGVLPYGEVGDRVDAYLQTALAQHADLQMLADATGTAGAR